MRAIMLLGFACGTLALSVPADPPRQRRQRYQGRYPKRFEEKYKEHKNDAAVVERVKLKGGTPAGSHVPIMAAECLAHMGLTDDPTEITTPMCSITDGGLIAVDCTLGFGGHSEKILAALATRVGAGDSGREPWLLPGGRRPKGLPPSLGVRLQRAKEDLDLRGI